MFAPVVVCAVGRRCHVVFGMVIPCRWEVWLQVAKRIGILAGPRFHVVFLSIIPCRWEVWLQVAKRLVRAAHTSFFRR